MATRVFVYGASGHAKVIIDILERMRDVEVAFAVDDAGTSKTICGYEIIGGRDELLAQRARADAGIVAIGDNKTRRDTAAWLVSQKFRLAQAIHPHAVLARDVKIGAGTVIMAGCVVNSDAALGENVIVNTGATIDHDCVIGDCVHIAPGCHLCGKVRVGDGALLGVGTCVKPNMHIGDHATIGAGSTVVENIAAGAMVAGTPAKPIKRDQ